MQVLQRHTGDMDEAFMEHFDAGFNVTEDFIRRNPVYAAGRQGNAAVRLPSGESGRIEMHGN